MRATVQVARRCWIQATTDNANRTVAEIRNVFQRHGANLAATNAVAWMFDRKGQIVVDAKASEDATMEAALDAGAEDMEKEGDIYLITTPPTQLHAVDQALRAKAAAGAERRARAGSQEHRESPRAATRSACCSSSKASRRWTTSRRSFPTSTSTPSDGGGDGMT